MGPLHVIHRHSFPPADGQYLGSKLLFSVVQAETEGNDPGRWLLPKKQLLKMAEESELDDDLEGL